MSLFALPDKAAEMYVCHCSVVTGLRRHLLRDAGSDRRSVAFTGCWRRGREALT